MLNGALTIGTLDGANIEMREECGDENIYTFGFTVEQVQQRRQQGYDPHESLKNGELCLAIDQIRNGYFSPDDRTRFSDLIDTLLAGGDHWMVLGDYQAYIDRQRDVARDFRNPSLWYSKCVHNIGAAAKFSSDRTIEEYAKEIWFVVVVLRSKVNNGSMVVGIANYTRTDGPIICKRNQRHSLVEDFRDAEVPSHCLHSASVKSNDQHRTVAQCYARILLFSIYSIFFTKKR